MEDNFEVRGSLHEAKLRELSNELKSRIPPSMGFTILLFDNSIGNDHGATYYASTAGRDDTVNLLNEFIQNQTSPDPAIKRISYRITDKNPAHTRFSMWVNGGMIGQDICLRDGEFYEFMNRLRAVPDDQVTV